jgi:DNA polymerase-3 subunit delta
MKTIDNDIKTGQFKKVYLLYGAETYLLRQYRDKLKKALVSEDDSMNFSAFEGKDINQNEIIDLAETLPFFAERRVILIENSGLFVMRKKEENADSASGDAGAPDDNDPGTAGGDGVAAGGKAKKGGDAPSGEGLAGYIASMPDSTCLLFVEEKADKRSKLYKAVAKAGYAAEFAPQNEETIQRWVLGRLKKEGKGITQQAYQLFIQKTGTDMENIDREMEKLICYTLDKENIEPCDVEAITTEQTQNKIFEMVDAISSHQQKKALDLYYDLLSLREPAMRIMYLITRQFHILAIVKAMSNQGFGNRDIASKAGCPDWAVRKYQAQCRGYSLEQLRQAVEDGTGYEEAVKTGQLNDQMAVELFIVQYSAKSTA